MNLTKVCTLALFAALLYLPFTRAVSVESQVASDAPTSIDLTTNGFVDQATMDSDRAEFEQIEGTGDGLGPLYNANSCAACHANPVTGAESMVSELRAGHYDEDENFVAATVTINDGATIPDRSLINDRAICPGMVTDPSGGSHDFQQYNIQERVPGVENVRALRRTTNVLGDGFVEAIDDGTLIRISDSQPAQSRGFIHGLVIRVPVAEANGALRVGRFGWKNQHASLLSFAGDAYLNEMGITNRFNPTEVTGICDMVADPEDKQVTGRPAGFTDIDAFAEFIRSTKPILRDDRLAATADSRAGQQIFSSIGCSICHVTSITTAPPGTLINSGTLTVPAALGGQIIHPYSDFLLHDVGTGDGIVQNGGRQSQDRLRTPPLWGLRFRNRLMHDTMSLTRNDAILRHSGEARLVINSYRRLDTGRKNQLITFLNSL
jgi:CxxC motif-containing protein (DUF1111 family)